MEEHFRGTVLVVDDDEGVRAYLAELITALGGTVCEACDGQSCIDAVEASPPDLILLDVEMPGMSGFTCCRALKSNPVTRMIPVILVTSLSSLNDRVGGIEAGADDFLTKPARVPELLARIRTSLRVKKLNESLESAESVVLALARAIEARDECTGDHIARVSDVAVRLGILAGCSENELTGLRQGGVLHDIGKVAVPDSILNKPGKLTPEEFAIMKQHPLAGCAICSPMKSLAHAIPCIRWHHEKPNGTGYPDGLRAGAIPRTALILAIADIYDALVSKRPYKEAFSHAEAVAILREEARQGRLDAALVHLHIENCIPLCANVL